MNAPLSERAFAQLTRLFREESGIELSVDKRVLVQARLGGRLLELELDSFDAYCGYLQQPEASAERRTVVELLTTNETFFFREPLHFTPLRKHATTAAAGRRLRIWSAACSSGEEAYSVAMTLLDARPARDWELVASDLSERMLEVARCGVYPMQRLEAMPEGYLRRFCLRGTGPYEGSLRVSDELRGAVRYVRHNLLEPTTALGAFDVVFLRNVLIYFSNERRQEIVHRVLGSLREDGLLFVGHAESLHTMDVPLRRVQHSVYRGEPRARHSMPRVRGSSAPAGTRTRGGH